MNLWIDSIHEPEHAEWIWLKDYDIAQNFIECALDPYNCYPYIRTISISVDWDIESGIGFLQMLADRRIGGKFIYHLHQSIPNNYKDKYTIIKECIQGHGWQIVE